MHARAAIRPASTTKARRPSKLALESVRKCTAHPQNMPPLRTPGVLQVRTPQSGHAEHTWRRVGRGGNQIVHVCVCGPVIGLLLYLTMALVSQRTCTPMRTVRNYPWLHPDIPPQHVHVEGLSSYVPCVSSVPLQRTQILGKIPFTTASTSRGTPPKSEPQVLSSCPRMRILNLNR